MLRLSFTFIVALAATAVVAGEHNPKLNIGDAAPAWSDLPRTDGGVHSLADLKDKKLVVVVFTCNSCPVAVDYEDRIIEFAKKHAADVAVVAINVSRASEDSLEKMQERATAKGFPYPYLFDASQKIGQDYGASGTPEFFVLSPTRQIVYMGAMDDSADLAMKTVDYLEPAVQAALAGKTPEIAETHAHGCRIRYARKSR
jgi:peroxiredoxin